VVPLAVPASERQGEVMTKAEDSAEGVTDADEEAAAAAEEVKVELAKRKNGTQALNSAVL